MSIWQPLREAVAKKEKKERKRRRGGEGIETKIKDIEDSNLKVNMYVLCWLSGEPQLSNQGLNRVCSVLKVMHILLLWISYFFIFSHYYIWLNILVESGGSWSYGRLCVCLCVCVFAYMCVHMHLFLSHSGH